MTIDDRQVARLPAYLLVDAEQLPHGRTHWTSAGPQRRLWDDSWASTEWGRAGRAEGDAEGVPIRLEYEAVVSGPPGPVDLDEVQVFSRLKDGWTIRLTLSVAGGEPAVTEIAFRPGQDAVPSATKLRAMRLGAVVEATQSVLEMPYVPDWLGDSRWRAKVARPGRKGTPDEDYLEWAEKYVAALNRSPLSPVPEMVAEGAKGGDFLTAKQVLAKVGRARRRGLLTPAPPGKPGGKLTKKAQDMIAERDERRKGL